MKNTKGILLLVAMTSFLLTNCKKGEDDPFFSLRSRKARITGEWVLKSGSLLHKETGSEDLYTYDGSYLYTPTDTIPYAEKWTINKDGRFELNRIDGNITAITKMEGSWSFGNKDKAIDLKNKESIIFRITKINANGFEGTQVITYTGIDCPIYAYTIKQLKNNTMTINYDGTNTPNSNYNSTETQIGTMTFEQ